VQRVSLPESGERMGTLAMAMASCPAMPARSAVVIGHEAVATPGRRPMTMVLAPPGARWPQPTLVGRPPQLAAGPLVAGERSAPRLSRFRLPMPPEAAAEAAPTEAAGPAAEACATQPPPLNEVLVFDVGTGCAMSASMTLCPRSTPELISVYSPPTVPTFTSLRTAVPLLPTAST